MSNIFEIQKNLNDALKLRVEIRAYYSGFNFGYCSRDVRVKNINYAYFTKEYLEALKDVKLKFWRIELIIRDKK